MTDKRNNQLPVTWFQDAIVNSLTFIIVSIVIDRASFKPKDVFCNFTFETKSKGKERQEKSQFWCISLLFFKKKAPL